MDEPYRFMRIGYSALAWLVSAGQPTAVPYALVGINVAALTALAYMGGLLAQQAGWTRCGACCWRAISA